MHKNKQQPDTLQSSSHHNTHTSQHTQMNQIHCQECHKLVQYLHKQRNGLHAGDFPSVDRISGQYMQSACAAFHNLLHSHAILWKKEWKWEENINSNTKGTWSMPKNGALMLIGLYFNLPLEASAYMWGWIKRPTRIYGKSMHRLEKPSNAPDRSAGPLSHVFEFPDELSKAGWPVEGLFQIPSEAPDWLDTGPSCESSPLWPIVWKMYSILTTVHNIFGNFFIQLFSYCFLLLTIGLMQWFPRKFLKCLKPVNK